MRVILDITLNASYNVVCVRCIFIVDRRRFLAMKLSIHVGKYFSRLECQSCVHLLVVVVCVVSKGLRILMDWHTIIIILAMEFVL